MEFFHFGTFTTKLLDPTTFEVLCEATFIDTTPAPTIAPTPAPTPVPTPTPASAVCTGATATHIGWVGGTGFPRFDVVVNGSGTGIGSVNLLMDGVEGAVGFLGFGAIHNFTMSPTFSPTLTSGDPNASVQVAVRLVTSGGTILSVCPAVTFALNPAIPDPAHGDC
jgi:hypothetical protein